ncbi:5-bromo-4-chloroindolyl phosphate hydrolysis family protein [Eubacterium limosum]|uniref:5-bromo-4-chloroindolyl phosphate hydrolysis family protein n=1 Tax=Eubacterium limosum TaxID=1736 RepID=A0ABT5UIB4_EUBLI|nr:5-bromo-4-chloroindolyl phosphate hydrolysis family protein [Eubacterium limosum]MCB6568354.1 5-bromo-4-chloroindolyl phosphate hydrolysis family protein [Eubacterium limosum]MDE1468649.1 5-bromo-4-chloroindolyl phosphate hydrolysis family protein [Eubacterium limosum]
MSKNDYSNLGEEIKSIVKEAINSTDFKQLNKNISNTVNSALEEVKKGVQRGKAVWYETNARIDDEEETETETQVVERPLRAPVAKSPAGKISSIIMMIIGYFGIGFSAFVLAAVGIAVGISGSLIAMGVSMGVLIPLLIICIILAVTGTKSRGRVKRFYEYVRTLNGQAYISVKQLASSVGKNDKFVVKDLLRMIRSGMFPEGRINDEKTYLLLSDEAYDAYEKYEEGVRLREREERRLKEEVERQQRMEAQNPILKETRLLIEEGKESIEQIREANEAISGEVISQKLDRLEIILCKIFEYVENHTDELPETRKFMGYYLPTTLKLVNAYREMDAEPIQGENIRNAKHEIEATLDTINYAFENLLDSFYQDKAMDISTDITVLETMLAQEGLTEKDFNTGGK